MDLILPHSDCESVASSCGSNPSEVDESILSVKRELRTLGTNMQLAQRRQISVSTEQAALKRPHEESVSNLTRIVSGLTAQLAAELAARAEVLATVGSARENVAADLAEVDEMCASIQGRLQRYAALVAQDAQQRREAAVEAEGVSLVLAEQKRKVRLLTADIEELRRTIVLQEQEVYNVNKAVKKIKANPQWEVLGLQFMRQWSQDKQLRLRAIKQVYSSVRPHKRGLSCPPS